MMDRWDGIVNALRELRQKKRAPIQANKLSAVRGDSRAASVKPDLQETIRKKQRLHKAHGLLFLIHTSGAIELSEIELKSFRKKDAYRMSHAEVDQELDAFMVWAKEFLDYVKSNTGALEEFINNNKENERRKQSNPGKIQARIQPDGKNPIRTR